MKITITGSLGNIGKPLTMLLVKAGHDVTVVSSDAAREPAIRALGATAAIGSVSDVAFLTNAFAGAASVFAMTPPNLGGSNVITNTANAGNAFAQAIQNAGVKRVVMLSSIGADLPDGNGPIAGLHQVEQRYDQLKDVSLTYLRAGYFYTNYFNDIPLVKGAGIIGANYPGATSIPLVHPKDIAQAAAEELVKLPQNREVKYVVSDIRTGEEIARIFGNAVGKTGLPWVEFTDEQALQGMTGAGLPAEMAGLYTEMGVGFRNGRIPADFIKEGSPVTGKTKLEDFAQEFAAKF